MVGACFNNNCDGVDDDVMMRMMEMRMRMRMRMMFS